MAMTNDNDDEDDDEAEYEDTTGISRRLMLVRFASTMRGNREGGAKGSSSSRTRKQGGVRQGQLRQAPTYTG